MPAAHNRQPSQWDKLFRIATDLIGQVRENTAGYPFDWSFGGGTAMMIQIGHRESHDIDIFFDDGQILGFLKPAKAELSFAEIPAAYDGDGVRFQKFAFDGIGEIDFIIAGPLTSPPTLIREIQGVMVALETIPEIIAKKIYHRGADAKARDVFDIAASARHHRAEVVTALRAFPGQVTRTRERLEILNPEFVARTIGQLMILPDYLDIADRSLDQAKDVLDEVLSGI